MSPILFNIYFNDLAEEMRELNLRVNMGDSNISLLLYADDFVLIEETEQNLQKMLSCFEK